MKAIVLAAGKGTRLLPITDNRPKHLLNVAGQPILKRILDPLIQSDQIDEILIVTHFFEEAVREAVKLWYTGISKNIRLIHQDLMVGTGDALLTVVKELKTIDDDFVVVYGDLILGNSIINVLNHYSIHKSPCILGTHVQDPSKFGVLQLINDKLTKIIEKPESVSGNELINAGLFIFPKSAFNLINELKISSRNELELTDLIELCINQNSQFEVIECSNGWFDIGHPWQLLEANEYLIKAEKGQYNIEAEIEKNVHVKGEVFIAKNAKIRSGSYIEGPVYIDEGADIGPNCYIRAYSYIGKNVRVGNGCEIKNSIIYDNSHVAHLSYIGDSIIGQRVNFGAGTITANLRHDSKNVKVTINDTRVDSGRRKLGAIIGDNVKTGIGVNLLPGIKIGSNNMINAGTTVSRDLI